MSTQVKAGNLYHFHKGLLSKKWKKYYFVLLKDSTLQWFDSQNDRKPEGSIRIRDIAQNLCVGPYTRCLSDRPALPQPSDEPNLIAFPRSAIGHHNQDVVWILCPDVASLNDWMSAIVSTLPPLPQQSSESSSQPSAPPPPYPGSSSDPRAPPTQKQEKSIYPNLAPNQQSKNKGTSVSNPSINKNTLIGAGAGFAAGAAVGGAIGYKWGKASDKGNRWNYGMGPSQYTSGYYGWGPGSDLTIINNYYDNDAIDHCSHYGYRENCHQHEGSNYYNCNTNHENNDHDDGHHDHGDGHNDYDGGHHDYDGEHHDYDGGHHDHVDEHNEYDGGHHDYDGGHDDYGGGHDDYDGGYGGGDNYGGGDDFGGD